MIRTLAILCFGGAALFAAEPAASQFASERPDSVVTIELPASATSSGLEIHVSDVATVRGADDALVARVSTASLGYAPAPGYSRTLRADLVQAALRQALPGVTLDVVGSPRCRVTPAIHVVRGSELRALAAESMRATLAGLDAQAQPTGQVPDLELPEGDAEPRMVTVPETGELVPGIRNVQVQVWLGDRLYRTVHVPFQVSLWERRAVLRRAVNVGDHLNAGLFEVQRVPVANSNGLYALQMNELAGSVALRPMTAGSYVTERDVHREVVIQRGAQVTVRVKKGAVVVTDVALAEADGRMGERVRVTLRSTGRQLIGVVRGRQTVEVTIQ